MPELPEVETIRRQLEPVLVGQTVERVDVQWHKSLVYQGVGTAPLVGHRVEAVARRGKMLIFTFDGDLSMLAHLRMTGQFRLEPPGAHPDPHDRVVIRLADGRQLHFHDTRKFGRFQLVADAQQHLAALGPEPLSKTFTPALLRQQLAGKRRRIKPLLLDQECVAGIGNIYADESLWLARIHPARPAETLTLPEITRLHRAIRVVLAKGVAAEGTTLGSGATNFYSVAGRRGRNADALQVFRRTGDPCPRCGQAITRLVIGQRGTHICPKCQRR